MDKDQIELLMQFLEYEAEHTHYTLNQLNDFESRIQAFNDYWFK